MDDLQALIEAVRAERAPDPRTAVFEVRHEARPGGIALVGATTEAAAAEELLARAALLLEGWTLLDEIVRLPDPELGKIRFGIVRAALAPVHAEPRVTAVQVSQYVLGQRVDLLSRSEAWWRVRGEDGYIGWVHRGYLETGDADWAGAWERGGGGEPLVSLGAELVDETGDVLARLPWGARAIRDPASGRLRLPDGRTGAPGAGELVPEDSLAERFPPHGESVVCTARRWLGTPYVWGGVTPAGADCSGFVQSVYRLHGLALPRDSDLQARVGKEVEAQGDLAALRPGDLLFFSERPGRITHVAISLGGSRIIHSALSNGGVRINDLAGDLEAEARLRPLFVHARRVLPD